MEVKGIKKREILEKEDAESEEIEWQQNRLGYLYILLRKIKDLEKGSIDIIMQV